MSKEKFSIDWRYRAATTLAKDWKSPYTGILHKKGTPVTAATYIKHGEKRIHIGDPSAPALFLSLSYKFHEQALKKHPFLIDWPISNKKDPTIETYDYLELIMASIIFAYTAIEAFANEELPEDFIYEEKTKSGLFIVHNKEWIERNVSLDEKLTILIPKVTNKPSPKGSKIWENYVHLRRLRHRIIHLKTRDRERSQGENLYPASIWSKILEPQQLNYSLIAKNMILNFRDKDDVHWLKYCPF